MAQHDYSIANQGFPATRADINNVLSAIATNNSGTSAPSTQYAGQFWIDTTSSTWTLYIHDGADDIQFATIDTSANTVNFIDSELGDNSVTTAKIADGNVTSAKLSYPLTTFSSTGIDDNATSTAITINSSEQVGIGTASPTVSLHVNSGTVNATAVFESTDANSIVWLKDSGGATAFDQVSGSLKFSTGYDTSFSGGSEAMRIDSSGNVGIGTSSPESTLHVEGTSDLQSPIKVNAPSSSGATLISDRYVENESFSNIGLAHSSGALVLGSFVKPSDSSESDATGYLSSFDASSIKRSAIKIDGISGQIKFLTTDTSATVAVDTAVAMTERMRIDSSGSVLINTTSSSTTTSGVKLRGDIDAIAAVRDSNPSGYFRRLNSDGDIINLGRDTATNGRIGVKDTGLYIGDSDSAIYMDGADNAVLPFDANTLTESDDFLDIGRSANRFDDIYATNGTIQTSDQNEKQSIQSLTTAEMNVAKRLSPLIKTFKWNSSVEEKGDNARTHTGIIAQDVQQAFTDEGLDAGNYALFISSTWWEKEISVEAVAEEVDENGNIITEAKDAYTYIDIKEEATDGYTERTRLGVRYPELLSFIQAYNDQRFTELEARITALENA